MAFFDGIGASLVGGGIGLLGGLSSDNASKDAVGRANDFTVHMMKRRHQWEVQDLRKAGLNPILSAGGTPSMGSSPVAHVTDKADAISKGSHSALSARSLSAQLDNIKQDTALKAAQAASADAAADLAGVHSAAGLQGLAISRPKADIARVVSEATGKFSGVAHSAKGAARQLPRFLTRGLPGILRRKATSNR